MPAIIKGIQRADERFGNAPLKCNQELLLVKDKDGRPRDGKRSLGFPSLSLTSPGCTLMEHRQTSR